MQEKKEFKRGEYLSKVLYIISVLMNMQFTSEEYYFCKIGFKLATGKSLLYANLMNRHSCLHCYFVLMLSFEFLLSFSFIIMRLSLRFELVAAINVYANFFNPVFTFLTLILTLTNFNQDI